MVVVLVRVEFEGELEERTRNVSFVEVSPSMEIELKDRIPAYLVARARHSGVMRQSVRAIPNIVAFQWVSRKTIHLLDVVERKRERRR